ncbi:two-component regulator propeller domain-containing protein [Polaribacter sp. Hel1_85]|uniref:type IX secretion system anionic LPS delivery protein PorZ n=1 Tax=Polaribacter sp. Hel1_85 TaxID=1250005 RepID=UPI00052C5949|nr:two-component regulator propeller domain-containing protein [Polaribacter sp. Hel1_85]KGL62141.1 putative surface protein [Polaribacter sp. Hel1_85]
MRKHFLLFSLFFSLILSAQTDYSDSWEDFYSYNNVKDFVKVDDVIYALADNAVFTYNITTEEINKLSSVQGLSGETTSSIHYNTTFKRLFIGYENGLVEVVDGDGTITISSDIVNFNQSGRKVINDITEVNNKLYLSTPFGIVVYDIENLEFGDTYFIGNNSSSLEVNQTAIFNGFIYAATDRGLFSADLSSNLLIDFNNWNEQFSGRNFSNITFFNNQIYVTEGSKLFQLNTAILTEVRSFSQTILAIKAASSHLSITLDTSAIILDLSMNEVFNFSPNTEFDYVLNNSFFDNNNAFLATKESGILITNSGQISNYKEIHPEGPLSNDIFSITTSNNSIWVVYGGYTSAYVPSGNRKGFSNYNGVNWINNKFSEDLPIKDLVDVTIDTSKENKVFIASFAQTSNGNIFSGGGLLEVENNEITNFYHSKNSLLEDVFPNSTNSITTRVSGASFDSQGNLWLADALASKKLKKLSASGTWSSYDLSSLQTNTAQETNIVVVDRNNSIWIGTRRNGVYVYNENGDRKKALVATTNSGNLPDVNVRAIAVDGSNRVWIGTQSGMVMYNNASGVFDDTTPNASAIVINGNEDGFGERLLGDQTINSIVVDGAENKWFGTDNGGVIYTNPNGQTTLANFSTQNSPLPSNKIVKIAIDNSSGKVYFATNKGMVAYNSNVAPFGDVLGDVYAYPNPALKNHEKVTIDGRNGTHLPKGTNVKILDVSGNLVYETNVVEGQELEGGKVVWNKKNLAGNKVASGVYIVLLSNDDASETAVTKIAIVN